MNKHKISVLIIFLLFIFIYHSNVLGEGYWLSTINNVHQDCYNLCWAACMEAINTPLGNDGTSQCELIQKSAHLGGVGHAFCCTNWPSCEESAGCNVANHLCTDSGSVADIFANYFSISSSCHTNLPKTELIEEIDSGSPIIINDSHMCVIIGYNELVTDLTKIRYCDPVYITEYTEKYYSYLIPSEIENLRFDLTFPVGDIGNSAAYLSYFNSWFENGTIRCEFETTFERASHHFLIQRYNAPGSFETLGKIEARGSQSTKTKYEFTCDGGRPGDKLRLLEFEDSGVCHIVENSVVQEKRPEKTLKISNRNSRSIKEIREDTDRLLNSSQSKKLKLPQSQDHKWVAIYPDSFENDVLDLITLRSLYGLPATGISIEDVNGTYGSIEDYIQNLWDTENQTLEYVFLVGSACNEDYCPEYNLIPINNYEHDILSDDDYISDLLIGDINGDSIPEIAVGRIPAESCYDVASYVNKLIKYEKSNFNDFWTEEVTFLIDATNQNSCSGIVAEDYSQDLTSYIPESHNLNYLLSNDSTFLEENIDYPIMQSKAIREFNSGRALVLGFGNGADNENFVEWIRSYHSNFQMDSLNSNGIFPFMLGACCHIAKIDVHYEPRILMKQFLFDSERGAIAGFAPSRGSWVDANYLISKNTLINLYDPGSTCQSLGYACMEAQNTVINSWEEYESTARSYLFLGDPAIVLKGSVADEVSYSMYGVSGDGTKDFTTITDAMNMARGGDTVFVYPGDYDEDCIELPDGVQFFGVGDSVRILIDSGDVGFELNLHSHTSRINNITFCSAEPGGGGRGILIDDSSPEITGCSFENFNGGASWGAVAITGDSYPKFYDCVFTGNGGNRAAVSVSCSGENETAAPEFHDCEFIDNNGDDNIITLGYNYSTPLDTAKTQPLFEDCVISGNSTAGGGLIGIYNCHAPVFRRCEITDNSIFSEWGDGVLRGQYSGIRVIDCTLAGNQSSSQYDPAPVFNFSMMSDSLTVDLDHTIVAFNSDKAINADSDFCQVDYSCIYGNSPEDTLWANNGTGNIMDDPAFCDSENGIYTLYNFSSCVDIDGYGDCMGVYGAACTPACDSVSVEDDYLIVCPAGDRDTLRIHVDFADSVMTHALAADEIWLQVPEGDSISFFADGDRIYADSAATEENGWHTTISRGFGGGRYQGVLSVGLIDDVVACTDTVTIKSPDYIADGEINSSDYGKFGLTWAKCEGDSAYNSWFDYVINDSPSCVDMSDWGVFGLHWGHCYSDSLEAMLASGSVADVDLEVIDGPDADGFLRLKVSLGSEQTYRVLAFMLEIEDYRLVSWDAETGPAAEIERDGRMHVFVGSFNYGFETDSEVGILTLKESGMKTARSENESQEYSGTGITLLGGELMRPDGKILGIGGSEIKDTQKSVVYRDRLYENYPNPFNPITTIRYSVSRDCRVKLKIFNVKGQLIKTLADCFREKGRYEVNWNGTNNRGEGLASGVYFYRLETDHYTETKKMILLR